MPDPGALLGLLAKVGGAPVRWARSAWIGYRYGVRLRLELGWEHPAIVFLNGRPTKVWRCLNIVATGPKRDKFVIAAGSVLCRRPPTGAWSTLADLSDFLSLPLDLSSSSVTRLNIAGNSLADRLGALYQPSDRIEIRVEAQDLYHSNVQTPLLELVIEDLRKEDFW